MTSISELNKRKIGDSMKLLDKSDGDSYVGAAFVMFMMLFMILVLGTSYSVWMCQFDVSENVDLAMTSTLKAMETKGCLDNTLKSSLNSDLSNIGMKNISISATTTKQAYGDEINISISGKADMADKTAFSGVVKTLRKWGLTDIGMVTFNAKSMKGTSKC